MTNVHSNFQKKNILFIFPYDWIINPRSVREVRFLQNTNYNVFIISTKMVYLIRDSGNVMSSPKFEFSLKTIKVYEIPFFTLPLFLSNNIFYFKFIFYLFYIISILVYVFCLFLLTIFIIIRNKIEFIHVHNPPDLGGLIANIIFKLTGIPYIYEVHDLTPEVYCDDMSLSKNTLIYKILKIFEYISVLNSEKNIFISKTMKDYFISIYRLEPSKCIFIYSTWSKNFTNIYKYSDYELNKLINTFELNNKFKVIYLGSLESSFKRGIDLLIKSLNLLVYKYQLSNVVLLLIGGDHKELNNIIQMIDNYQIRNYVILLGKLPRNEAYKWLMLADVAIHPLRKMMCTIVGPSNKLFEYMAAGKAIVASSLSGHREVIKEGQNGLLFHPNDHKDLANKIKLLFDNKETLIKIGKNAQLNFLKKYNWENERIKLIQIYTQILSR